MHIFFIIYRAVEPCKKCCSEPELVFNDDVCVY